MWPFESIQKLLPQWKTVEISRPELSFSCQLIKAVPVTNGRQVAAAGAAACDATSTRDVK